MNWRAHVGTARALEIERAIRRADRGVTRDLAWLHHEARAILRRVIPRTESMRKRTGRIGYRHGG